MWFKKTAKSEPVKKFRLVETYHVLGDQYTYIIEEYVGTKFDRFESHKWVPIGDKVWWNKDEAEDAYQQICTHGGTTVIKVLTETMRLPPYDTIGTPYELD